MLNLKEYITLIREVTGKSQPTIVVITTSQDSRREKNFNDVAIFSVDPATGLIRLTGNKVPFEGGPICIEFLD